ncbi:MAG: alpha/beta hydrolase [Planctomycetota bacterium]
MDRTTCSIADLVVDIYAPRAPSGAAVLFLHGFGSRRDGEKATYLGETLARAGIAFLAPDLQGHGESGGDLGTVTIERSIGDLLRVSAHPLFRSASRKVLLGSSFGGLVSSWAAVERPGLCDRLALIAPAFGFIERHLATLSREVAAAWRNGTPLKVEREWFEVDLSNRILLEAEKRPWRELAQRLGMPTLVLHGSEDESVPVQASVEFASACEAVQLEVIEGGDHRLVDHKELLAERIERFIRG